ncbi:MAG TPA: hypothetical protein VHC69_06065 [Polyangiaceae bacterium]|nr:hypothetical protein [Polyangiaceae bacterium]
MVATFVAACSSSKSSPSGSPDGAVANNGSGGKGTGGSTASASGGSSAPSKCAADAGSSGCRACLASYCCDPYTQCHNDPQCEKALQTQIDCFESGEEPSFCFGNFSRALAGDSGVIKPVPACIVTSCTSACGGPGVV